MRLSRLSFAIIPALISLVLAVSARDAQAECNCVAVAGDVAAAIAADVAKADTLYARGDFGGALAIYAKVHASAKESVLLYAQGMAQLQLGARDKAKALFQAYLAAGGNLAYKDKVDAQMTMLGGATAAVSKGVGAVGGVAGGVVGGVGGAVDPGIGAEGKGAVDTGVGVAGTGVGAVGGVAAGVGGEVKGKTKIGRKAGIILGVIAVAALGAVLIHGIAAGVKDDIELDAKFDLGMGIAGVSVGISAIYVAGLTAATGAAAGAPCLGAKADNAKPIGLAAGFRF